MFGRTDLRIGASGAKFGAESDFEVHLAVAPPKPSQNSEKLIFRPEHFADVLNFFLSVSKNEMSGIVWNAFDRRILSESLIFGSKRPKFEFDAVHKRHIVMCMHIHMHI